MTSSTIVTVENKFSLFKRSFKKALFKSAFFICVLSVFNTLHAAPSCHLPANAIAQKARVKWVYDGDTLLVTDLNGDNKRKVRIIGIDTPEVKHHQQKAQLYGAKAREELRALLKKDDYQILLSFDTEKRDRYDRLLAHTYLKSGESISEWLLKRGYAKTLIIPPNVKHADCFKAAEKTAQKEGLRLWKLKSNQVKVATGLSSTAKGYIRLKGKVTKVKRNKKTIVLELESRFKKPIELKVNKINLSYFKSLDIDTLVSAEVIISGILKKRKGTRSIYLNHPSQIEMSTTNNRSITKLSSTIQWSQ